jgi:hypothetical protein
MGKASKKKAQRRQGDGQSRSEFEEQRSVEKAGRRMGQMDVTRDMVTSLVREAARFSADPHVTQAAWGWDPGSAGHRFFSDPVIADARDAPPLKKARFPKAEKVAADPRHWENAVNVLVRAVVLDRVSPDDPAVTGIADLLAPVAVTEAGHYATDWRDADEFPETKGPLFRLGGMVLFEVSYAIVGTDPLPDIVDLLEERLGAALDGNGFAPCLTGRAATRALVSALTREYRFDDPEDVACLDAIQADRTTGNALVTLISDGTVSADQAVRAGVSILAALADLARTDAISVLWAAHPTAEDAEHSWTGGNEISPAPVPEWPEDSLGDRFFGSSEIRGMAGAPPVAGLTVPPRRDMARTWAHWEIAVHVLTRAVILEGITPNDASIPPVIEALRPVVKREYAAFADTESMELQFPEETGPLFYLGEEAMMTAVWTVVGNDPLAAIMPVVTRQLDEAVAAAGLAGELTGTKIAEPLFLAFPFYFDCSDEDEKFVAGLSGEPWGNPLMPLLDTGLVTPDNVVHVALVVLGSARLSVRRCW